MNLSKVCTYISDFVRDIFGFKYNLSFLDKNQEQDLSTPLLEYLAKQNDRQRIRVNQRDERRKKVFIRKQEKEDVRRNIRKREKEIFIKPKPISRSRTEEKPVKDLIQKYGLILVFYRFQFVLLI